MTADRQQQPGRLTRLVYAYTIFCVVGSIGIFLVLASWHRSSRTPDPGIHPPPPQHVSDHRPPPPHSPHLSDHRPPPPHSLHPPDQPTTPPTDLLLMLGGVLFVLVMIASYFFARRITIPLRRLQETATDFGNGNHSARVDNQQDDEIGAASRAFDDMAGRTSELIESQKELVANVSHELRTPLARMRVALDMAKERNQAEPELIKNLNLDVNELQTLVGDVLETLRVAMTGNLQDRQSVDLKELMVELVSSLSAHHANRNIILEAEQSIFCHADPPLLRRAIANLIENALKYSDKDIKAILRTQNDRTLIEIIDQGIGIKPDDLKHVFTPFFRAEQSRHRSTGGVGLGLSLVKRITEAHQGSIVIESKDGVGTTARIELPTLDNASLS